MEFNEFFEKFKDLAKELELNIEVECAKKFYTYMNMLIKCNENINLTAITEPNEVIVKHFIDSLTIQKFIEKNKTVIDVGTGAGFPGIPIGIVREDANILLMDALNKRINFLNDVCRENNIKNVTTKHSRAEELAKNKNYREKYDYATSRAVAALNVLLEYMLPFVKIGGYCICMKGSSVLEEIEKCQKALEVLGGKIEKIEEFYLPGTDMARNIVIVKKIKETPSKYPRKAGTPSKDPIC